MNILSLIFGSKPKPDPKVWRMWDHTAQWNSMRWFSEGSVICCNVPFPGQILVGDEIQARGESGVIHRYTVTNTVTCTDGKILEVERFNYAKNGN